MDTTPWISQLLRYLVDSSVIGILFQYGILVADTAILIYAMLARGNSRVVVLSHLRIWVGILSTNAMSLATYRALITLWTRIQDSLWLATLTIMGVILFSVFWHHPLQWVSHVATGRDCLRDLDRDWPLVPRCANQAMWLLLVLGIMVAMVTRYLESPAVPSS
jgi:hypothetical protein